jgi:hypothetical protein
MPKGYAEGPAAEEAERRLEELERGGGTGREPELRQAVYGSTEAEPDRHFIGWRDEVDPDELFASGQAWGIFVRAIAPAEPARSSSRRPKETP